MNKEELIKILEDLGFVMISLESSDTKIMVKDKLVVKIDEQQV